MISFAIGAFIGFVIAYIFGWGRSGEAEYREFKRGVDVGRRQSERNL